jgi:transglutaminase-like putative cysteine protease
VSGAEPSGRGAAHAPPWRVSAALALAIPLAFVGYHVVLRENAWWLAIAVPAILVLGVAAATRALIPRIRVLPSVVSLAVATIVISFVAAPTTTLFGLPTFATWDTFVVLARAGIDSLAGQEPPAVAEPGVLFLLAAGAALIAVISDAIAVTLRRPALTALILVPAALVPFTIVPGEDFFWLAVAVIAWLFVVASDRPARGRRGWDAVGVVGASLAVALLATTVVPLPSAEGTSGEGAGSIRSGVNPIVTLGDDLRREETLTALVYSTESELSHYLRLTALDEFRDEGWESDSTPDAASTPESAPPPPGLGADVASEVEVTTVSIRLLGGGWVPVPYPALGVEGLRADAEWDPTSQSLRVEGRSVRGENYEVSSLALAPTAQQLQDAGSVVPESLEPLAAADPEWPAIIAETAASATAGTTTNYERAVALQDFFRGGEFEYSERAPERGGYDESSAGAVAAFLEEQSGYCVQFASAMAIMARTLGIPSRLVLGFLPGEASDDDEETDEPTQWVVTSDELHAWPELYFEGIGWVPFEPTAQRGDPADYSAPEALATVDDAPTTPDVAVPAPSVAPSAAPDRRDFGTGALEESEVEAGVPPIVPWGLGIAVLLLLPGAARWLLRRRRLAHIASGRAGAELAWREVMETAADLALEPSATATPRANAGVLGAAVGSDDGALAVLLLAVEHEAFANGAGSDRQEIVDATRALLRDLRRTVPPSRRVAATLLPRTLLDRIARVFS